MKATRVTDVMSVEKIILNGESATVGVWTWNDGASGYASLSSRESLNIRLHCVGGMD